MGAGILFSQEGTIPDELLRPRRDESPRYPVDTVIGELGQGQASREAYECARNAASALLAGNANASALSSVNKVFLESCMSALNTVNPLFFRLGGGREGPDGSVSFLVRFAGREQGITGELFVRLEERRPLPDGNVTPPESAASPENDASPENTTSPDGGENSLIQASPTQASLAQAPSVQAAVTQAPSMQASPEAMSGGKVWVFEDLILEEARSREAENRESRHRFDFPPYERFF